MLELIHNLPLVVHRVRLSGRLKGLSVLRGNSSGAFLGEGVAAMSSSYPTRPDGIFGMDRRLPIVLAGTKQLFENFYRSKLTEDVRGQLTSRVALHYLLPELTPGETKAILRQAFGEEA